jgi:hypothetical protein
MKPERVSEISLEFQIILTSIMLNCQMFGAKKLATNHLAPWNEPPKRPISKGLKKKS